VTLRDQIKQTRRRNSIFSMAGLVMCAPPGLAAVIIKLNGAQPPEYWPLLVILLLAGVVLLLVGAIGQWGIRCPKCRAIIGLVDASKDKCCRRCGTDFDSAV
jgi:hypothetical protein